MQRIARSTFSKLRSSRLASTFAGAPKLDQRYFLLNMDIDLMANPELDKEFSKHMNDYIDKKLALICFEVPNGSDTFMLFQCPDETTVYDFVKKVVFLHQAPNGISSHVKKFKIEEVEVGTQDYSTELMKRFTALAR